MRTCVACRRTDEASALTRVRRHDGVLAVGPGPGRGAWCCGACAPTVTAHAFARALHCEVSDEELESVRATLVTGKTQKGIVRD